MQENGEKVAILVEKKWLENAHYAAHTPVRFQARLSEWWIVDKIDESIIFENIARFTCACAFFVVPLQQFWKTEICILMN
jgi:hypothetical protein